MAEESAGQTAPLDEAALAARVDALEAGAPVAFVDGACALCAWSARTIDRLDQSGEIRICAVQSPLGQAVLRRQGLDPDDPSTWLYIENGRAYAALDGAIRLGARLGGWGLLLQPFRLLPRPARDWLYARVAKNRYRMFGQGDLCALPSPSLRARLIG